MRRIVLLVPALLLGTVAPAALGDVAKKAPDPKAKGEIYEWKSAGGIVCWWRAPERYDEATGANLTLILHGSNLTHEWGFANHSHKSFRPDDFLVSPDGTTSNGKGGFNFLKDDTRKVNALVEELKKALKVRAVYLYGHSQGSFFALQYAGDFPEEVTGVVAHASGLWTWTQTGPKGHDQAIVFMHGTQDPVVPYGQSVGGFDALREAKYPRVRLRSLEGWNHWPAEHNGAVPHTSQQLAWVEGMTTKDPARLAACFDLLARPPGDGIGEHDFAGLWSLAERIAGLEEAPEDLRRRAARAKESVEALARGHVESLALPEKIVLEKKPWVGHLPIFLRAFLGVPARDELAERLKATLEDHRKEAIANLRKYWPAIEKGKIADAFEAAVAAIESGFLFHECASHELRKNLKDWRKDAKKHKISKAALKAYDASFEAFDEGTTDGWKSFEAANRKYEE
jgi:pimeloyl-ACP methyl ester carboxylesterase